MKSFSSAGAPAGSSGGFGFLSPIAPSVPVQETVVARWI